MYSALEQAYLDYMGQHGGSVGYGGAQAGAGTGGVGGAGPITTHANGSVTSGNGTTVQTRPDGTRVTTTVVDGRIVQTSERTDGTMSVVTLGQNGQPIALSGGIKQPRSHDGEVIEANLKEVNEVRHANGTRTVTLVWTDGSRQIQEFRTDGTRSETTYASDGSKNVELIAANGSSQFTTFAPNGDLYRSGTRDIKGNGQYTQHNSDGSVQRVSMENGRVSINGVRKDGSTWTEIKALLIWA
ncbi:hypothetical protein [Microvirga soli]|uniref:hypothetical protein n=1 Tax=Microvirga soli TaxID=1854496 RepID=UPI00191D3B8D|nr:hypothetical protein [Microvirga soli]